MKINFFNSGSNLYPFRWFIIFAIAIMSLMAYADLSGWRLLAGSDQEQWSSGGPGYHK